MKQFYYPIEGLFAEISEKSFYRSRMIAATEQINPITFIITDDDKPLCIDLLKKAADKAHSKIQTLTRNNEGRKPYEFIPNDRVVYNLFLPEHFNMDVLPTLYTAIKDYMIEFVVGGYFSEIGLDKPADKSQVKQDDLLADIQQYRLARTKGINTKHTMI